MNKFKITTEIREILLNNESITNIVGDRIFPIIAPKDTIGDFIIYQRDEYSTKDSKMGVYQHRITVYINAISDTYDRAQDLAENIYKGLEGKYKNPDMTIKLLDSTEDYEDGKYIQVLLFQII